MAEIDKSLQDTIGTLVAEVKSLGSRLEETSSEEKIKGIIEKALADNAARNVGRHSEDPDHDEEFKNVSKSYASLMYQQAAPDTALHRVQSLNDDLLLMSAITKKSVRQLKLFNQFEIARKAMADANVAGGAEWIPTLLSQQLLRKVRLSLKVAALFQEFNMPSQPFDFPIEGGDITPYKMGESTNYAGTTIDESSPGTGKITFSAVKLATRTFFSSEVEEDSLIEIMPIINNSIAIAMANGVEDAIINGDVSTTHMDSDVTSSADRRKLWKGLRKQAIADGLAVTSLSTFSGTTLRTMRLLMGKFGVDPSQLAWIVSTAGYIKMMNLAEVLTLEKYGANATVLNGELGKFDGIPIIVSEFMRNDLSTNGIYNGSGTASTTLLVRRDQYATGRRRGVTVKSWEDIDSDRMKVVSTQRLHFREINGASSSNPIVALGTAVSTTSA